MTQIMGSEKKGLTFEIISARIADKLDERKYVVYSLQIRFISENDDLNPSIIERRYSDFLELYNSLKKEHPNLMNNIVFPKKVILGNFNTELISTRSTGFEYLLKHISNESRLRNSNSLLGFLQNAELNSAKELLKNKENLQAYPILEHSLKLLNKVFTDRSPAVILALVRLVDCVDSLSDIPDIFKWADLAIHRYEAISDSDLLELYVPLLKTCIKLWYQNGRNPSELEKRLTTLQKQGINVNESISLADAVNSVEQKILRLTSTS